MAKRLLWLHYFALVSLTTWASPLKSHDVVSSAQVESVSRRLSLSSRSSRPDGAAHAPLLPRASDDDDFPSAFTTLTNNFTNPSCPEFFGTFLQDSSFKECHALSILLQNSNDYFRATRSRKTLEPLVETACSADMETCSSVMADFAAKLNSEDACKADFELGNPTVTRAYAGLMAYEPLYKATCLRNATTDDYCFVDAATNSSNASDYYIYFLPLGMSLPGGSRPTCNKCLRDTMDIFTHYATLEGQPLAKTYMSAAEQLNTACGPDFANTTVQVAVSEDLSSVVQIPSIVSILGHVGLLVIVLATLV